MSVLPYNSLLTESVLSLLCNYSITCLFFSPDHKLLFTTVHAFYQAPSQCSLTEQNTMIAAHAGYCEATEEETINFPWRECEKQYLQPGLEG